MWTPKRIALLVVGFVLFAAAYIGYAATSLGRINTLPPLPDAYKRARCLCDPVAVVAPLKNTRLDVKLQQAFGPDCKELKWPIRLELGSRSMALASNDFSFQQSDGRVKVQPLSLALFGKNKKPGGDVEINTLRSQVAYIKFNRPVHTPYDVNGSQIERIELTGKISISNNRGTLIRDDDLNLYIPTGPLYYDEKQKRIWTSDDVHLTDERTQPKTTTIDAHGMDMDLLTEAPPPRPGDPTPHKSRKENVTGVRRIVLQSDVLMVLYLGGPGLFGTGKSSKPPARGKAKTGSAKDNDKTHVTISTPGSFEYIFGKTSDEAIFRTPTGAAARSPRAVQHVTLVRHHDQLGATEQLICDRLDLKLRRREQGASSADGKDDKLEIETAHAVGKEVLLTSDLEKLVARGNEFFHDAIHKKTILKAEAEVEVDRDDTVIHARELQLQDVPGPGGSKGHQDVLALGPGQIDLADKKTHQKNIHAYWKDRLISRQDGTPQEGGPFDLLVLIGDARFQDDVQGQSLKGETLNLWLVPQSASAPAGKQGAAGTSSTPDREPSRRPDHLVAVGHVLAHSREMDIHDCSRLTVKFNDVPPHKFPGKGTMPLGTKPAAPPPAAPAPPPLATVPPPAQQAPTTSTALKREPTAASAVLPAKAAKPAEPQPNPIDLSARWVEVEVLRCGEQNALKEVWTEGEVRVRQEPNKPDEDGVDITGDTLKLTTHPEGNFLVVTGDSERLATLSMDKIDILGPEVKIDQATNMAWVYGAGGMSLKSNTNLQGEPINRTVPLEIRWNKSMLFFGDRAEFIGDIQAEQENSRMACQQLTVFFDRPISLKEGNRGGPSAKVRSLVGDQDVRIEDTVKKGKELQKYQRLTGQVVHIITVPREEPEPSGKRGENSRVDLHGPGTIRIVQRGGPDPMAPPAQAGAAPPVHVVRPPTSDSEQLKLTYVTFLEHMTANNQNNTASFYGNVRVLSMPCDNPYVTVDMETALSALRSMPEGTFFLMCERLQVSNQPSNGRPNQEMTAVGTVHVYGRDFEADADKMTFNQEKDQIIFYADGRNTVSFWKQETPGQPAQTLRAGKVTYVRSTGRAYAEEIDTIRGH